MGVRRCAYRYVVHKRIFFLSIFYLDITVHKIQFGDRQTERLIDRTLKMNSFPVEFRVEIGVESLTTIILSLVIFSRKLLE